MEPRRPTSGVQLEQGRHAQPVLDEYFPSGNGGTSDHERKPSGRRIVVIRRPNAGLRRTTSKPGPRSLADDVAGSNAPAVGDLEVRRSRAAIFPQRQMARLRFE